QLDGTIPRALGSELRPARGIFEDRHRKKSKKEKNMKTLNKENEITIIRFLKAPVKTVWEAWTDPKQAEQWWGPRGFTTTTHSKDFRVGGMWHYTMHGPDGADYINKTIFLEIEPLKKMVYDHGGNDERKPLFRVTVLFTEVKGGTELV